MAKYGICQKCNLNYIDYEKQEICDICKKQILGQLSVIDDFSLEEEYTTEELHSPFLQTPLPPDSEYEEEKPEVDDDDNATWRSYIDDNDYILDIPDFSFEDEADESDEDTEKESTETEYDDFEYVSADDYYVDDDNDDNNDNDDNDDVF